MNVYSDKRVHTTAFSVFKPTLNQRLSTDQTSGSIDGNTTQQFTRYYSHVCLVTKMFIFCFIKRVELRYIVILISIHDYRS